MNISLPFSFTHKIIGHTSSANAVPLCNRLIGLGSTRPTHKIILRFASAVQVHKISLHFEQMTKNGGALARMRCLCVIGLLSLWILLALNVERMNLSFFIPHSQIATNLANESLLQVGFLVNTEGCRIPDLDPFDISIRSYIQATDKIVPITCAQTYGPALLESNTTSLFFNYSVLLFYNVTDVSQLRCCYTPFWRVQLNTSKSGTYPHDVDKRVAFSDTCTLFNNTIVVNHEFVKTECFCHNSSVYIDYHAFTPPKATTKERAPNEDAVSVLVLGVDAVSRLNLYREMPQTLEFLTQNLGAIEMLGYNKVADNTFPNLVPVLTGLSERELTDSCWPTTKSVFDDCNFVWKDFSAAGYKTAFGEDSSWMGVFSYLKRGFRQQPTDYYMKPFSDYTDREAGFDKRGNANLCVGPRKAVEYILSYAFKFAVSMKNILSFGFFWGTSLTHDFLCYPRFGDVDHKQLLENLYNEGVFNKSVLIVLSDHGIRWGEIRKTYQGYLEERLPFLFIAYPDWFSKKYTSAVGNLRRNARRLTTPYDLHQFLLDLVNLTRIEKDELKIRSEDLIKSEHIPRGISMFLPIPGNRTCSAADINDHWCACHQSVSISVNDSLVASAAYYVVEYVNTLLSDHTQCARLKLLSIVSARVERPMSHSNFTTSNAGLQDFFITLETSPGKAVFESTVRYNGDTKEFNKVGTVSRINMYGDQSKCIQHYRLRLYCYCLHGQP